MSTNILEVRGVSIALGGLQILDDIELTAERGQITGVIGPNGAGKTTLFNIVSGFMRPESGSVLFDGRELIGAPPERISKMGLVRTFQKVRGLPHLSVRDNVMIGALINRRRVRDTHEIVDRLLSELGLEALQETRADALPIGFRKRLEVARALATEPRLLLLDEVMGGLVPSEIEQMMTLIRRQAESGTSVILIEHHMKAVMGLSKHVIVLERGRNLAAGSPAEVTRDPGVLTAYLGEGYEHVAH